MTTKSVLQQLRASYQPKLPNVLKGGLKMVVGDPTESVADQEQIEQLFPTISHKRPMSSPSMWVSFFREVRLLVATT